MVTLAAALAGSLLRGRGPAGSAVAHVAVGLARLLVWLDLLLLTLLRVLLSLRPAAAVVDDDVDPPFGVLLKGLVVVARLGELGDYVPGVDGAGDLRREEDVG